MCSRASVAKVVTMVLTVCRSYTLTVNIAEDEGVAGDRGCSGGSPTGSDRKAACVDVEESGLRRMGCAPCRRLVGDTHRCAGDQEGAGARDVPDWALCHVRRRSTRGSLVWRYGHRHRSDSSDGQWPVTPNGDASV